MLIDDILNNSVWTKAGVIGPLRTQLIKAPKFILRCDFAMAVDELTHNDWPKNCNKIIPLCRLPYQECWVEVAHNDRLAYRSDMVKRKYEVRIKRVGWLLTQVHDNGTWIAQMFWSVDQTDPEFQKVSSITPSGSWVSVPLSGAIAAIRFNPQAATAEEAIEGDGLSAYAIHTITKKLAKEYDLRGLLTDWEGEGSFLMATLALINSKNVTEYTPVSFQKKNKAAMKSGQSPLYDHKVISIHTRYSKRNLKSDVSDGRKFRSHFCRGHFKIRKTGVFFWSAHRRGDLALGSVPPRDYHVTL